MIDSSLIIALQKYHLIFKTFWELSDYRSSREIPSAAIVFERSGNPIKLIINPDFWNKLTFNDKLFVICHEMLHPIMDHGYRFNYLIGKGYSARQINIMNDIVINEMLFWHYGFKRSDLSDFLNDYIWTIERGHERGLWKEPNIENYQSTEYYLNRMSEAEIEYVGFDQHNFEDWQDVMNTIINNGYSDLIGDLYERINKTINEDLTRNSHTSEPSSAEKSLQSRGISPGNLFKKYRLGRIKPKKKWETVLKKWAAGKVQWLDKERPRFERVDRRLQDLMNYSNAKMPAMLEIPVRSFPKNKIPIYFFLDTSGSCISYSERFFKAAATLDANHFNIKLYCFDTSVYKTTLKSGEVFGGGGTSFDIIEEEVQRSLKEGEITKYPTVWILTDGAGNDVRPQKPEKWYWYLTENGIKNHIPTKSHVYDLAKFE